MLSTSLFFFSYFFFPFFNLAYSQLADQYGADIAKTILKRYRSKPLRGNTHTSGTPRYPRRNNVPLYPFKSKYGQNSSPSHRF